MTSMLAARNIQGGHYDCWKVTNEAEYPKGPGESVMKAFKVVFRLKKESATQEEDVKAQTDNDARKLVQTKYRVATYLIVSITEIKG